MAYVGHSVFLASSLGGDKSHCFAWLWHRRFGQSTASSSSLCRVYVGLVFPSIAADSVSEVVMNVRRSRTGRPINRVWTEPACSQYRWRWVARSPRWPTPLICPASREYDRGASYGYALFTLVAESVWDIHADRFARACRGLVDFGSRPSHGESGCGLGYSFIAEAI